MIATIEQARSIISIYYGQNFADSIRFVKRSGISILMKNYQTLNFSMPTLCWRKLEKGSDATVWIGKYLGYDAEGMMYYDWNWSPESEIAKATGGAR